MSGELQGFASRALLEAVKDESWLPLCDRLHEGIRKQIADMNVGKRFCELSASEQVALVEKNWKEMAQPQNNLALLDAFAARMSREVDEEILKHVLVKSNPQKVVREIKKESANAGGGTALGEEKDGQKVVPTEPPTADTQEMAMAPVATHSTESHPTNVDDLVREFSAAAIEMLESGPANLMNTTKLFINRPLPGTLRAYIWSRALWSGNKPYQKSTFGRLAPSLDLVISRRVHALLDNKFARLSSRANAAYAKTVACNFMKMCNIALPSSSTDSFEYIDVCIYLCIPLIVLFRSDFGSKKVNASANTDGSSSNLDDDGYEKVEVEFSEDLPTKEKVYKGTNTSKHVIENSLYALMEARHLGCLRVTEGKIEFIAKAPGIGRAVTLLSTKDSELYLKLWSLRPPAGGRRRNEDDSFLSEKNSFEDFFNEQLFRGLSGLLNLETCMFVWDQGFIKDFGGILSLVIVALALGNAAELKSLTIFTSAIDTFTSYCHTISIAQLQDLLGKHFPKELNDLFNITGNYRFRRGNDGTLQAVYKRIGTESAAAAATAAYACDSNDSGHAGTIGAEI